MSTSIAFDPESHICELRIRGILERTEFTHCEIELSSHIDAGERPSVLVILEDFEGWEKGNDWDNLEFMFTHGSKITRIAIVGADSKEAEVKAFTGAGIRSSPVRFFTAEEIQQARDWLLE